MIDLETLATTPDAVILTIGAQSFDPFTEDKFYDDHFYARIDTECQDERAIDDGTVEWWGKQGPEAQAEAFGEENRWDLKEALEALHPIIWKAERIWANGIVFDMGILEHAYKSLGLTLPWQYYKVMDARTVYNVAKAGRLGNSHHALEDCVNQIVLLQKSLKKLNIRRL
jgi:hypothetical protein